MINKVISMYKIPLYIIAVSSLLIAGSYFYISIYRPLINKPKVEDCISHIDVSLEADEIDFGVYTWKERTLLR